MPILQRYSNIKNGGILFTGNTLGLSKAPNTDSAGTRGSIGAFSSLNQALHPGRDRDSGGPAAGRDRAGSGLSDPERAALCRRPSGHLRASGGWCKRSDRLFGPGDRVAARQSPAQSGRATYVFEPFPGFPVESSSTSNEVSVYVIDPQIGVNDDPETVKRSPPKCRDLFTNLIEPLSGPSLRSDRPPRGDLSTSLCDMSVAGASLYAGLSGCRGLLCMSDFPVVVVALFARRRSPRASLSRAFRQGEGAVRSAGAGARPPARAGPAFCPDRRHIPSGRPFPPPGDRGRAG